MQQSESKSKLHKSISKPSSSRGVTSTFFGFVTEKDKMNSFRNIAKINDEKRENMTLVVFHQSKANNRIEKLIKPKVKLTSFLKLFQIQITETHKKIFFSEMSVY